MLWFPEWRILVVDDDPDVLRITELALRRVEVEGVPVKIFTAGSKAEAIQALNEHFAEPGGLGLLTVALIDVVMETDTAGLELCDYIRNTMGNSVAQLYIRTGQPGVAPERDVIDQYDITGYFSKVEATEDKLYTMVKSGVRQYVLSALTSYMVFTLQGAIDLSLVSQDAIGEALGQAYKQLMDQRGAAGSGNALWVGDSLVWCAGYSPDEAMALRDQLLEQPAKPIGPTGEAVVIDPEPHNGIYHGLFVIPEGANNPPVLSLSSGNSLPKANFPYYMTAVTLRSVATLWATAGQRAMAQ